MTLSIRVHEIENGIIFYRFVRMKPSNKNGLHILENLDFRLSLIWSQSVFCGREQKSSDLIVPHVFRVPMLRARILYCSIIEAGALKSSPLYRTYIYVYVHTLDESNCLLFGHSLIHKLKLIAIELTFDKLTGSNTSFRHFTALQYEYHWWRPL